MMSIDEWQRFKVTSTHPRRLQWCETCSRMKGRNSRGNISNGRRGMAFPPQDTLARSVGGLTSPSPSGNVIPTSGRRLEHIPLALFEGLEDADLLPFGRTGEEARYGMSQAVTSMYSLR